MNNIPKIGLIVSFKLMQQHADEINKRRSDANSSGIARENSGSQVHVGNSAKEGDVYPMMITRVWSPSPVPSTPVNGQVFLDGNDTLWVTSAPQGTGNGQWATELTI
jgi:hypothetical protein